MFCYNYNYNLIRHHGLLIRNYGFLIRYNALVIGHYGIYYCVMRNILDLHYPLVVLLLRGRLRAPTGMSRFLNTSSSLDRSPGVPVHVNDSSIIFMAVVGGVSRLKIRNYELK